jgi:hypothetical protein
MLAACPAQEPLVAAVALLKGALGDLRFRFCALVELFQKVHPLAGPALLGFLEEELQLAQNVLIAEGMPALLVGKVRAPKVRHFPALVAG